MSGRRTDGSDGGPAFPVEELNDDGSHYMTHPGKSLRDWFAGQALIGMLAHSRHGQGYRHSQQHWHAAISEEAYEIADAMLEARK